MQTSSQFFTENRLITLNSAEASVYNNGQYLSDVSFFFRGLVKPETDTLFYGLSLLNAEIPISFYNVNEYNQSLSYRINGVTYQLVVPVGNYTSTTFLSSFISLFAAAGHSHTLAISLSRSTGRLTFTKTGTYDVIFESSSLYDILGFLSGLEYTISSTLTAPHQMNMLGVKKLKILSPSFFLHNFDSHIHTSPHLLHTIPVTQPPYSLECYQNPHINLMHIKNRSIDTLYIRITDENNNLVDFNNAHWCMTLCLSICRKYIPPSPDVIEIESLAITPPIDQPTEKEVKILLDEIESEALEQLEFLSGVEPKK